MLDTFHVVDVKMCVELGSVTMTPSSSVQRHSRNPPAISSGYGKHQLQFGAHWVPWSFSLNSAVHGDGGVATLTVIWSIMGTPDQ